MGAHRLHFSVWSSELRQCHIVFQLWVSEVFSRMGCYLSSSGYLLTVVLASGTCRCLLEIFLPFIPTIFTAPLTDPTIFNSWEGVMYFLHKGTWRVLLWQEQVASFQIIHTRIRIRKTCVYYVSVSHSHSLFLTHSFSLLLPFIHSLFLSLTHTECHRKSILSISGISSVLKISRRNIMTWTDLQSYSYKRQCMSLNSHPLVLLLQSFVYELISVYSCVIVPVHHICTKNTKDLS